MSTPWPAPPTSVPVRAVVRVPGSKSMTNRALLLAGLSGTGGVLRGAPRSRDSALMVGALRALGVPVLVDGPTVRVGAHRRLRGGDPGNPNRVDCGLAGTVMRFVPPAAALADGAVGFDGDPRARERPISTVLDALRALGCAVDGDALPFVVRGRGSVPGGTVTVDASASSQFVSGLLLSGARYDRGLAVRHDGQPLPSLPHVEMTVAMLRAHGVEVDDSAPYAWRVLPGPITGRDWDIEPDLSNAAVFLAAAAATAGQVTVRGWPARTTQAGDEVRPILEQFGCAVARDEAGLTVHGPKELTGIDVDLHDVGELTPTVAALAALAGTPSRLRGVAHLRGHETDRLAALAAEITGLGGAVTETPDGLEIDPRPLHSGLWRAYADHRMATAGAILGLVVPGVVVDDIAATAKTMADFPGRWAAMVAGDGR